MTACTHQQVIKIFDYIDEEQTGFVDRFDFMEFCNTVHFGSDEMKQLKDILISRIEAFSRFCQIGSDGSIEIVYSKYTVNPCYCFSTRSSPKKQTFVAKPDPYYCCYYDDHILHEYDHENLLMLTAQSMLSMP